MLATARRRGAASGNVTKSWSARPARESLKFFDRSTPRRRSHGLDGNLLDAGKANLIERVNRVAHFGLPVGADEDARAFHAVAIAVDARPEFHRGHRLGHAVHALLEVVYAAF